MSRIVLKRKEHGTKRKHQEMSGTVGARLPVKRLNEKCQALEAAKPKVPCVPWKGDFWSPRIEWRTWEMGISGISRGFYGNYCLSIENDGKPRTCWPLLKGFQRDSLKRFLEPLLGYLKECLCLQTIFGVYPNMRWNHPPNKWDFQQTKHGTWRHSQRRRYQDLHRPSNARRFQLISGRI